MSTAIPCTVQILTRNSVANIRQCLEALKDFAEVIVLDGYSTDGTREVLKEFSNVRVMDQNKKYLDNEGRIADFAAVRNEGVAAAQHDWLLMIDSDEAISAAFVEGIRAAIGAGTPAAYRVFRRFFVEGKPIAYAASYPAYQIRLVHRSVSQGYAKSVHERLILKPGTPVLTLQSELPVPLPPAHTLEPKYARYLAMEVERLGVVRWQRWLYWILLRNIRSIVGLFVRVCWIRVRHPGGAYLPWAYEKQFIVHACKTAVHTFPPRVRALQKRS